MSQSPYAAPAAPGGGVDWQNLKGSLLLIKPLGVETDIPTVHGAATAVRATITVLDGADAGTVNDDVLVFPRVMQGQIKSRIGQLVLGRLTQGVAKPGQTAPWQLAEATQADIAVADEYMRKQQQPQVQSAQAPF